MQSPDSPISIQEELTIDGECEWKNSVWVYASSCSNAGSSARITGADESLLVWLSLEGPHLASVPSSEASDMIFSPNTSCLHHAGCRKSNRKGCGRQKYLQETQLGSDEGIREVTKIDCKCTHAPAVVCLQMSTPLVMAQVSCSAPHHCPPCISITLHHNYITLMMYGCFPAPGPQSPLSAHSGWS